MARSPGARARFLRVVAAWVLLTAALAAAAFARARISAAAPPPDDASRWAEAAIRAALEGGPLPHAPRSAERYRAPGPIVVSLFRGGREIQRYREHAALERAVRDAAGAIAAARGDFLAPGKGEVHPRITIPLGYGALPIGPSVLEGLGVVPLVEGIEARVGERSAVLTPDDLLASGAYDRGTPTPIPDLRFGLPLAELRERLARELGVSAAEEPRMALLRFRAVTLGGPAYPKVVRVTERALREAAVDGARFLLRHQRRAGRYVYVYDAASGTERLEEYNVPRHAGTTYFLAQVDRLHGMPEARAGALRALTFLKRNHLERCGGPEILCIRTRGAIADVGSAALTLIAATELLAARPDPLALELTRGLTAFLRAQQRPDGELMHEYDLAAGRPNDVQYMYYSGEAAFALLKAHAVTGDPRDLEAARRVMAHLTGAGWDFLGSRYYYGEEHWTCIAAGEARERVPTGQAAEFCERWLRWNDAIQFRKGQTPWPSDGAYGVGPLVVPRLTPVGSRTEALIAVYDLFERGGRDVSRLRRVIEGGLSQMLRYRWAPGPVHLFADPAAAFGGMPGSPADLASRNDFVQHSGSAFLRWADHLRARGARSARDLVRAH